MGKANDEKKQVNMDESTTAREERDRDIRALMALMEEGDLSALRFDDGNVKIELERATTARSRKPRFPSWRNA